MGIYGLANRLNRIRSGDREARPVAEKAHPAPSCRWMRRCKRRIKRIPEMSMGNRIPHSDRPTVFRRR
jgi:hypothetical protein